MTSMNQATPRPVFHGFKDESGRTLPVEREAIPIHLPYFYIQARKGPLTPHLVVGDSMLKMYGAATFNELSKYYSHQTMGVDICNGYGNAVFLQRVAGETAKVSRAVLCCEIVEDDFEAYERDELNVVLLNPDGTKKTQAGVTVNGQRLRWLLQAVPEGQEGNVGVVTPGSLTGKVGAESTVYPIMEFEAAFVGEYGNGLGFRLSFPHVNSDQPASRFVTEDQKTAIYRMQFVERDAPNKTPIAIETTDSEREVDFSFKPGVVDVKTDSLYGADRLISNYENKAKYQVPVYAPMARVKVYQTNLETVLGLLKTAEDTAGVLTIEDIHQINPFTGLTYDVQDFEGFRIDSTSIALNSVTTHYLVGGDDGVVSEEKLDELVDLELTKPWNNSDWPLLDRLKYPFSALYDTGFTMETKKKFFALLGRRPDIHVAACTQDMLADMNSTAADSSVGAVLRAAARLTPESSVYGTEVCRAVITSGVGPSTRSLRGRVVPSIMDLIAKRARYWGQGIGKAKAQFSYDTPPVNRMAELEYVSNYWMPETVRNNFWEMGVNYVQSADRFDVFWPAYQTVYSDDTSILNSEILMQIMVDVTKRAEYVWTLLTGDTKLTQAQFKERSDELFAAEVAGRYDGRVIIVGETRITPADDARGFSWHMDIAVYGNNMKTVGVYNIIARRRSDLEA